MLASSYAILISHFVFRYLVILRSKYTSTRFRFFMSGSFGLCAAYVLFFGWVCESWLYAPETVKSYIRSAFREEYGADPDDFNMLSAIYSEGSEEDEFRSWIGVLMLVFMSTASISTYVFFGWKIIRKLNDSRSHTMMSQETAVLQRKLLIALTVQTIIPICISFMPSLVAWFSPVFNYNMGRAFNYTGTIALSAFPFLDPVAIIFFLPILRQRLWKTKQSEQATTAVSFTMNSV